jgi:hypothetical protein
MLHLTMNCYYGSARGEAPVLRDQLKIKAAGRSIAIEEAYRQAEFLRATYFELRDPSQFDNLVYSSIDDGKPRRPTHASYSALPSAMSAPAMLTAVAHPAPPTYFKTLSEFQRWFAAQMKAHKRARYRLLEAAMKKTLPGRGAGGVSAPSSGSGRTDPQPRARKRNLPRSDPAPGALPSS